MRKKARINEWAPLWKVFLLKVSSCLQFCEYKICLLTDFEIELIIYISLYF